LHDGRTTKHNTSFCGSGPIRAMTTATPPTPPAARPTRLDDLPLWRLIVMLDDAERTRQADQIALLTRVIQARLRGIPRA
jgi:hypothetical protein